MISSETFIKIYVSFAFLCAMPWAMNWATRGAMPVSTRLLSMFIFTFTLVEAVFLFAVVFVDYPDKISDAVNLLAPMFFISLIGIGFVLESLVKFVKASQNKNDETN